MKFSGRATMCVVVMLGATGAFSSCSEKTSGGENPPVTADDIQSLAATDMGSIQVLSNDTNLTNEPLKVTIDESPTVGSATVNTDNSVRLDVPSGFHGVTRFKYKVTNDVGGFSISTAVVFVDVPAYTVLFAASSSSQPTELYVSNFASATKLTSATSGTLRLRNAWYSEGAGLVVYDRANPSNVPQSLERYYIRTTPIGTATRITEPSGRNFVDGTRVVVSNDNRWVAFQTTPQGGNTQVPDLYVLDTSNGSSAAAVGQSDNVRPLLTQWSETTSGTLYFMSAPAGNAQALYRATSGAFDAPERISPIYPAADTNARLDVSPDGTKILLGGVHNGQTGIFLVDPTDTANERRLTTDIPPGAVIDSYLINEDFTQVTYLWRSAVGVSNARLATADIADSGTPSIVQDADINQLNELSTDGNFALVTRGPGGGTSDGSLFEVALDRSTADQRIADTVGGGFYDDTGDRVFLFSRTLAPAVIERSNFNRATSPLVRSNTAAGSLFVTPDLVRSTAFVNDSTAGLVQINASAPGKTIRLTTLDNAQVGTGASATLLPAVIVPPASAQ